MSVHTSNHPVLLHKLTLLRKTSTSTKVFRELLREITFYLGCVFGTVGPLAAVVVRLSVVVVVANAAVGGLDLFCLCVFLFLTCRHRPLPSPTLSFVLQI